MTTTAPPTPLLAISREPAVRALWGGSVALNLISASYLCDLGQHEEARTRLERHLKTVQGLIRDVLLTGSRSASLRAEEAVYVRALATFKERAA